MMSMKSSHSEACGVAVTTFGWDKGRGSESGAGATALDARSYQTRH
jgi:hypothetical protein